MTQQTHPGALSLLLLFAGCATQELTPTPQHTPTRAPIGATLSPVSTSAPTATQSTSTTQPTALTPTCDREFFQLRGPTATQREACEEATLRYGDCKTIKLVMTAEGNPDVTIAKSPGEGGKNQQFVLYWKTTEGFFAKRLGTDGEVWVEHFPIKGGTPDARYEKQRYTAPNWIKQIDVLSTQGSELILWYTNPKGGFREDIPEGHQINLCGVGPSGKPSCSDWLFLTRESRVPTKDMRDLFVNDVLYQLKGDALVSCKVELP